MLFTYYYLQIDIWEERKVFGSRGQILKEEFAGKHGDNSNRNGKPSGFRLVYELVNTLMNFAAESLFQQVF